MKQCERIAFPVGCGAAVIKEHSNTDEVKLPMLSVCLPEIVESIPFASGNERDRVYAPSSITIFGNAVRDLYEGLRKYYGDAP